MRKRGYSGGFAAGISPPAATLGILLPPSITMILSRCGGKVAGGCSCRHRTRPAAGLLFGVYAVIHFRKEFAAASAIYAKTA